MSDPILNLKARRRTDQAAVQAPMPANPDEALILAQRAAEKAILSRCLSSAVMALRSYEHGNGSPEVAKMVADDIESKMRMLNAGIQGCWTVEGRR